MSNILDVIASYARERVIFSKQRISLDEIKYQALNQVKGAFEFEAALKRPDKNLSFICECKKASPSKGLIAPDFNYIKIAKDYELAGADAVSALTEPKYFLGHDEYLREIASVVKIPVLRKDFVVDEYMIYEAKTLGAGAVLLICAILDPETLRHYISICDDLGMSALVEAHNEHEIKQALKSGARIIGVNNRNLHDFSVDTHNSSRLRELVPDNIIFISESGVSSPQDVKAVHDMGANAVLIGEALMRADDKRAKLRELKKLL